MAPRWPQREHRAPWRSMSDDASGPTGNQRRVRPWRGVRAAELGAPSTRCGATAQASGRHRHIDDAASADCEQFTSRGKPKSEVPPSSEECAGLLFSGCDRNSSAGHRVCAPCKVSINTENWGVRHGNCCQSSSDRKARSRWAGRRRARWILARAQVGLFHPGLDNGRCYVRGSRIPCSIGNARNLYLHHGGTHAVGR